MASEDLSWFVGAGRLIRVHLDMLPSSALESGQAAQHALCVSALGHTAHSVLPEIGDPALPGTNQSRKPGVLGDTKGCWLDHPTFPAMGATACNLLDP